MEPLIKIDAKESDYLHTKISLIKNSGLGLFTAINIYKDEIISYFKGEILSQKEANLRASKGNDAYFINMIDGTVMDSMFTVCFAKYANDANGLHKSKWKVNSNICLDENAQVCIAASKNIRAGQEIFCSYGKKYWLNYRKMLHLRM